MYFSCLSSPQHSELSGNVPWPKPLLSLLVRRSGVSRHGGGLRAARRIRERSPADRHTDPTVPVSADDAEAAVPPVIAGTWRPAASCSAT
jgi:hypothetical protein